MSSISKSNEIKKKIVVDDEALLKVYIFPKNMELKNIQRKNKHTFKYDSVHRQQKQYEDDSRFDLKSEIIPVYFQPLLLSYHKEINRWRCLNPRTSYSERLGITLKIEF